PIGRVEDGDALEIFGRAGVERARFVGGEARGEGGVDLAVGGDVFEEFGAAAGEEVDDAGGDVARRAHFAEDGGGERVRLAAEGDDGVAGGEHGGDQRDEA